MRGQQRSSAAARRAMCHRGMGRACLLRKSEAASAEAVSDPAVPRGRTRHCAGANKCDALRRSPADGLSAVQHIFIL